MRDARYESKFNRIIQFAPIRTGSTILWQILDYMFEDKNYKENKWKKPNYVVKAHKLHKKYVKEGNVYLMTVRNPLDAIASAIRCRFFEHPLSEIYDIIGQLMVDMFNQVYEIQDKPDAYLFRYEFFNDNHIIFLEKIEEIFDIVINEDDKAEILRKFSREENLKISKQYTSFQELDLDTLIHGDHVSEKVLGWREIIHDENIQQYYITHFEDVMKKFNYPIPY